MRLLLEKLEKKINSLKLGEREIYIWGTGNTSELYAPCFKAEGISPVAFVDNNIEKVGGTFLGKPVISPRELREDAAVLVCSQNQNTTKAISMRGWIDKRISKF